MSWIIWIIVAFVVLICGLLLWVIVRSLWDPIYCGLASKGDLLYSSDLINVGDDVYISEHVITSGDRCCLRYLNKFSRMLIVVDNENSNPQICLFNPAPLCSILRIELEKLGTVTSVVVTNCFHYMYVSEYYDAFPSANFIIPQGMLNKRPELGKYCKVYPHGKDIGSVFRGTQYFRLPDFLQDHVIYVDRSEFLFVSDTLIARKERISDPSWSILSCIQVLARSISVHTNHGQPVHFCDYSRQYRRSPMAHQRNVDMWKHIATLPISKVTTGHGVYEGYVPVNSNDIKSLIHDIELPSTNLDVMGAIIFRFFVLDLNLSFFFDWSCLFTEESRVSYIWICTLIMLSRC